MIVVTSTTAMHLPRAMLMGKSVKQHMPDCKVIIGLMEEHVPAAARHCPYADEIVLFKDLNIYPNFYRFIFQYHVMEAAGTGKAQILKYAFEKYESEDLFVYMDTDMQVLGPFEELETALREYAIVLTPHMIRSPDPFIPQHLKDIKFHGNYNAGFIALRRDPASYQFINWWLQRVRREGYINSEHFGDQTWIDVVPSYFDKVLIFRHPGYNVAFWNYQERTASVSDGGQYLADGLPLRCFHFSNYNASYLQLLGTLRGDQQRIYMKMRDEYAAELAAMDRGWLSRQEWSYGRFSNGSAVSDHARVVFRKYQDSHFPDIANPFLLSNEHFMSYA